LSAKRRRRGWWEDDEPLFRVSKPAPWRGSWALVLIANAPLQAAAWRELEQARHRLEIATRDLHRHENIDAPEFRAWLGQQFAQAVSEIRDLSAQVERDCRRVQQVEAEAFYSGRSPRAVWRDLQRPPEEPTHQPEDEAGLPPDDFDWAEEEREREQESADDDPFAQFMDNLFGDGRGAKSFFAAAHACYRRMASRLHPDRGGEWTPARERLWHEVQTAWAQRDGDWLMRLEAEWEIQTEVLGPTSGVSRLRAARYEVEAARRDADRKLCTYRAEPAWRFSMKKKTEAFRAKIERSVRADLEHFRTMAEHYAKQIAVWNRPTKRVKAKNSRRVSR
jgi:hypothetical protein